MPRGLEEDFAGRGPAHLGGLQLQFAGYRDAVAAAGRSDPDALRVGFVLRSGIGDAAAVDSLRHRHEGMRRLGKWRVIVVFAKRARLANVGDVDDAQARVPAARPELIAEAQRMVQAVFAPDPGRLFAGRDMLARHPPARHFLGPRRIADVVDDEDVADVAFHLGRDVGAAAVHVEAMHTASPRALMLDQLRPPAIGDVVELEAAVRVRGLLGRAVDAVAAGFSQVLLDVDDHQIAGDAGFVAVRIGLVDRELRHELRLARIGHIEDGCAEVLLVGDVADVGVVAIHRHLPGARELQSRKALHLAR